MRQYIRFSLCFFFLKICNAFSTPSPKQIPITVISGFLGSGKTTLLQTLLDNKEGLKIAVIVNDVASVNIDSKLVSESNRADGMVQLQNGCACCSLSEELLGSVSELVTLSDMRGETDAFDHIVVELSGVADPKGVRSQFQEAFFYDMPIMDRVRLDTMVTVIDCSVFLTHLRSSKVANRKETPELFYREGEEIPEEQGWMEDMPPLLLEALLAGDSSAAVSSRSLESVNAVADLLVSQTETADIVLLNKVDLVEESDDLTTIDQIVTALNAKADVKRTTFGKVRLQDVLAVAGGKGVVEAGLVDDHREAIQAAEKVLPNGMASTGSDIDGHSHEHSVDDTSTNADDDPPHSHNHGYNEVCEDPDTSHSHSHSHGEVCEDPGCTDTSHSHSHSHGEKCEEKGLPNGLASTSNIGGHSHEHSGDDRPTNADEDPPHSHNHGHNEVCEDPDCTDTSHSHSHSHVTTLDQLGIGSFVYRARKPFHPQRLVAFLRHLPINRGLPEKDEDEPLVQVSQDAEEALRRVVRSKGFVWLGDSNIAANYWSHSGTSFELQCLGRWWSTLPRPEWPSEATATILADFDDPEHEEGSEDSVGDRRQEVVFIGPGLLSPDSQVGIVSCLDQCLLDDKEWKEYKSKRSDETSLRNVFSSSLTSKVLSY